MDSVVTIDPNSMQIHVEGYGDMTADVARELARMRMQDMDRVAKVAKRRQAYLAREGGEQVHLGRGEARVVAQIDEAVYQHWTDRYGSKFFADKGNLEHFLKYNPECRVKSRAKNPTLLVDGFRTTDRRSSAQLAK